MHDLGPRPPITEAAVRTAIDRAGSLSELAAAAALIPRWAAQAVEGGREVQGTTATISALNDAVTIGVVHRVAHELQVDLRRACWLAFGSQARGEQTIATDQDNGLIFDAADGEAERSTWLAFGRRVNEALADCGYALCSGNVMAGQRLCCLTPAEWCLRFEHWMKQGSGNDLLAARIYFDLRPLAGNGALAEPLLALLRGRAASVPRFLKQLADIVLCNHVPLNWLGRTRTALQAGREAFDLKMSGTALFVDAARLWSLAFAIAEPGTVPRLRAAASSLRVPAGELAEWISAFERLQWLRLQVQAGQPADVDPELRCLVMWDMLDAQQRQTLNRALRVARIVQQRIALDYRR